MSSILPVVSLLHILCCTYTLFTFASQPLLTSNWCTSAIHDTTSARSISHLCLEISMHTGSKTAEPLLFLNFQNLKMPQNWHAIWPVWAKMCLHCPVSQLYPMYNFTPLEKSFNHCILVSNQYFQNPKAPLQDARSRNFSSRKPLQRWLSLCNKTGYAVLAAVQKWPQHTDASATLDEK